MDQVVLLLQAVFAWIWAGRERGCPALWHGAPETSSPVKCCLSAVHGGDHRSRLWLDEKARERTPEDQARTVTWPNIAPNDRERAGARVVYLLPELTDDALQAVLLVAEAAPKRPLDRAPLDAAQRCREAHPAVEVGFKNGEPLREAEDLVCLCPATSEYDPPCPRHGVKGIGVTGRDEAPGIGSGEGKTLGEWAEDEAAKLPEPGGAPLPSMAELEAAAVQEQHDREVAALRSQAETLAAEVERMRAANSAGDAPQALRSAGPGDRGELLRLLWLEANKLGDASIATLLHEAQSMPKDPEITSARASSPETGPFVEQWGEVPYPSARLHDPSGCRPDPRPVPGEIVDVEHSGERGPRCGQTRIGMGTKDPCYLPKNHDGQCQHRTPWNPCDAEGRPFPPIGGAS